MMQVETEVEKESGLVLREVNLTNLKVRAPSALEHTHELVVIMLYLFRQYYETQGGV